MAKQNLIVRGGADFSGIKREMAKTQERLKSFQNSVGSTVRKIGAILGGITLVNFGKESFNMAKDVEASLGQIERLMGSSASAFKEWADTQAKAYNMSKSEAYKYGSVFSNLISAFAKDTAQTAQYTQDLLKAAAVVASGTGRTMEDTLDRIRSGLLGNTEAIEDLGINVNIAMIESTEAFKRFANGKSWNQLDFQTQQLIRYFAILEQASTKFGDTVANNTASRLAQFNATLSNIKLNIGNALMPVINAVLPPLTAFAAKVEAVTKRIAQFFQALFGNSAVKQAKTQAQAVNQQTVTVSNLGGALGGAAKATEKVAKATEKVAKARKKAYTHLAGFDEITSIKTSTDTDSGSSGSSGVGGGGTTTTTVSTPTMDMGAFNKETETIPKKIKKMANKIKKFFEPVGKFSKRIWTDISGYAGEKFKDIVKFWKKYGGQFLKAVKNIWNGIKPIVTFLVKWVWGSIKGMIDGVIKIFKGIIKFIGGAFTGDWKTAFSGIKDIIFGAFEVAWNFLNLTFFKGIIKGIGSLISSFRTGFKDIVTKIKEPFNRIDKWFSDTGTKMWDAIKKPFSSVYSWFKTNVLDKIAAVFTNGKEAVAKKAGEIWSSIKGKFTGAYNWFKMNVGDKIVNAVANVKNTAATKAGEIWGSIKSKFTGAYNWFKSNVADKIWQAIGNVKNSVGQKAGEVWNAIKGKFTDVYGWFKRNVVDKISSAFSKIKFNIQDGLYGSVKSLINKLIDFINAPLKKIKDVSIFGTKPFSKLPLIPKLAQGGYVRANNPMLAIIGDNRTEGEIVAPESKLYEQTFRAVTDALRQSGGGNIELTINLGSTRIFHEIIRGINTAQRQAGKTLLNI